MIRRVTAKSSAFTAYGKQVILPMGIRQKEGRRIKSLCPMNQVAPFIMKTRGDATNYYTDRMDITRTEQYVRAKKEEGYTEFNLMYVILAAYVRTVALHPHINRFIRGQRIYARNCIEVMLTIKNEMALNADETVLKVILPPDATATEIYTILNDEIKNARSGGNTDFDGVARFLGHVPRILLRFAVGFLNFLDYFGWMPRRLTKLSPFHGSMAITSMGSLRLHPIYHHLYNFGNIPVFCAFGSSYPVNILQSNGEIVKKKYVDLKFTLDERITDGYGYADVFHSLKRLIQSPAPLDERPEHVLQDID